MAAIVNYREMASPKEAGAVAGTSAAAAGTSAAVAKDTAQHITYCKYDEPCCEKNLCGDCAADEFESQQNQEAWENFKLDRRIVYDE